MGCVRGLLWWLLLLLLLSALTSGCDEKDLRRLAAEEAAARKMMVEINKQLQSERNQLTFGWNRLESERRAIAGQRRLESLVAIGMREGGAVVLAVMAIGLVCYMARATQRDPVSSDELVETLLVECAPGGKCQEYFPWQQTDARLGISDGRKQQLLGADDQIQNKDQENQQEQT